MIACCVIHRKVELTTAAEGKTTVMRENAGVSEGPFRVWWDVPTL
jgi:hypothetical protein